MRIAVPKPKRRLALASLLMAGGLLLSNLRHSNAEEPTTQASQKLFHERIAPLFERACLQCHNDSERKGQLSLETAAGLIRGGESGAVVEPGKPQSSRLIEMIAGPKPEMPKNGSPLEKSEVEAIRDWIASGAEWPKDVRLRDRRVPDTNWWSLQPIAARKLPQLSAADERWCRTPIDWFIMAKLREKGLSPSAEADRRTLIRRLSFDLIGLPPTPEEVDAFIADSDDRAYENVVDRLLASPRYGERWARHWLDVVHYGDTHGFDKDKLRPNAWPYRDYVIRSLNDDKSYTRFVEEQLAGDRLFPDTADGIVALGFIAAGPFDYVGQIEVSGETTDGKICRLLDRDDMARTTMETFCSLTVGCARCHNHKFDPITQEDYYSLQAVFAAVDRADRPFDRTPEIARERRAIEARRRELAIAGAELDRKLAIESVRALFGRWSVDIEDLRRSAAVEAESKTLDQQLKALPPQAIVFAAATEFAAEGNHVPTHGKPRNVAVLKRGDVRSPVAAVGPGAVACIAGLPARFTDAAAGAEADRRAALAHWIISPQNPLTWRSIVNRVWHYHFGRGLVDTPNDFGRMGSRPTHPELLDWLSTWFRDEAGAGQSLKKLHKMIAMSAVYQQASVVPADGTDAKAGSGPTRQAGPTVDADNRYLWRMNRRKLEAEAIRDSVLLVAGKLDLTMGGPGYRAFGFQDDHSPRYLYDQFDPDDPQSHRRSIYRLIVRSAPDPFFESLDCADPSALVDRRNETLTALQALAMLNNKFMVRMAGHFAERVEKSVPPGVDWPVKFEKAFRLALGRSPTADERAILVEYGSKQGLTAVCRLILNMNEFAFAD